ncbi:MAG: ArgE/DapE family deacylase [Rubellimicrobium sp.]|nr:ArgE/DapE family deacylase [Rubellimicrobium sp.]
MGFDEEVLRAAVDAGFAAQTEWLARLVGFDTTRGKEAACQDWLAAEFATRGYAVDRYTLDEVAIEGQPGHSPVVDADYSRAVQVVASHRVAEPAGRSLILQGHIDVVPPGAPELWARDPFRAEVIDGWMHGRGTADMKGGVSAMVFALDALARIGFEPASTVHLETVSEEECTGNGALSTLVRGYRADAALIPESMGHRIIRAELGSVWFRLRILGRPGHVLATAAPGAHAILAAQDYIAALQALTAQINREARTHAHFGSIDSPVKFNPGRIHGGDWLGSVPSWCELDCRLSVLPGQRLADVRARVAAAVAACAEGLGTAPPALSWIGFQADGHVFAPGTAAEAALAREHRAVIGTDLDSIAMTATSDTRFYDLYYGIPALCYGAQGRGMHSPDEAIDLDSLRATTLIIARFIANWCGLRPVGQG